MLVQREHTHTVGHDWQRTRQGLFLPPHAAPPRPLIAVDLFAGAGGFSCGFHEAGWHVAAAIEYDTAASATYLINLGGPDTTVWTGPLLDESLTTGQIKHQPDRWVPERAADILDGPGQGYISNHPEQLPCEHFFKGDVRALTGAMILNALNLEPGDVDAVIGGPPCQGFSRAGRRDVMDPRNSLVFDFVRLVCEIQPKTFVMENVAGIIDMLTPEGVPVLDALALELEYGGMGEFGNLRRSLYGTGDRIGAVKGKPPGQARKAAERARVSRPSPEAAEEALF